MKTTLSAIIFFFTLAAQAQLSQNDTSGFYEHSVELQDRQAFASRLSDLNLEPAEDLKVKGKFSHMVNGFAPVEISYLGKERNGSYVLTNFKVKGGVSSAWVNLEELPKKHQKRWISIINEKIESMAL